MINEIKLVQKTELAITQEIKLTVAQEIGWFTRGLRETFASIFQNYDEMGVVDEVFIAITLMGIKGCLLETSLSYFTMSPRSFDRNMIIFPEYIVNRTDGIKEILNPALNLIGRQLGIPKGRNQKIPNYN